MNDYESGFDPPVTAVTAPSRSGKTTVVDMMKSFLQISVNNVGATIANTKYTANYRLFCGGDAPLKICADKAFVDEHLSRHPVVHVDYGLIETGDTVSYLREGLRKVLFHLFRDHEYLLHNSTLWRSQAEKDAFIKYINVKVFMTQKSQAIADGFPFLLTLLYRRFGKPAVVLIDDFDAYTRSLFFDKTINREPIISFFTYVNAFLFKRNAHVSRVFVAGVVRVTGLGVIPDGVEYLRFMGNHKFNKYFGFSVKEVDDLVTRNVENATRRRMIRDSLRYYEGYVGQNGERYCSPYSIARFFENDQVVDKYWVTCAQYIRVLSRFFRERDILDEIKELTNGRGYVLADISKPLTKLDASMFNNMTVFLLTEYVDDELIERFWVRVYDMGYLTVLDGHEKQRTGLVPLKIPNKEVRSQYKILLDEDDWNNHSDDMLLDDETFKLRIIKNMLEGSISG